MMYLCKLKSLQKNTLQRVEKCDNELFSTFLWINNYRIVNTAQGVKMV